MTKRRSEIRSRRPATRQTHSLLVHKPPGVLPKMRLPLVLKCASMSAPNTYDDLRCCAAPGLFTAVSMLLPDFVLRIAAVFLGPNPLSSHLSSHQRRRGGGA